ncbi:MAG: FHA domain-containing protein [bacterium]|nr:FHA domain-containing protein [bacterium]
MIVSKMVIQENRELRGWLVVLTGQWKGRDFSLFEGKNMIGSSHYANIYIPENSVEHFHFSIRFKEGEARITDLDSDTGVSLGGKQVYREVLADEAVFETADPDTGDRTEFLLKML